MNNLEKALLEGNINGGVTYLNDIITHVYAQGARLVSSGDMNDPYITLNFIDSVIKIGPTSVSITTPDGTTATEYSVTKKTIDTLISNNLNKDIKLSTNDTNSIINLLRARHLISNVATTNDIFEIYRNKNILTLKIHGKAAIKMRFTYDPDTQDFGIMCGGEPIVNPSPITSNQNGVFSHKPTVTNRYERGSGIGLARDEVFHVKQPTTLSFKDLVISHLDQLADKCNKVLYRDIDQLIEIGFKKKPVVGDDIVILEYKKHIKIVFNIAKHKVYIQDKFNKNVPLNLNGDILKSVNKYVVSVLDKLDEDGM